MMTPNPSAPDTPPALRLTCTREIAGHSVGFEWRRSAYVTVACPPGETIDLIPVWDYRTDTPAIEQTPEALAQAVDDWLRHHQAALEKQLTHGAA